MVEIAEDLRTYRSGSRRSHQIPNRIERVHADVDKGAAARSLFFREPIADANRDAAGAHKSRFRMINFAEAPFFHERFGQAHRWRKTKLPAEEIDEVAFGRFFPQHFHFGCVHRGWLLAQDMFSGFERRQRSREMQKIRQTNNDRINTSVLQKLVVIGEAFLRRVLLFECSSPPLIEISAPVKVRFAPGTDRLRMHLTRPTGANDPKLQFLFHSKGGSSSPLLDVKINAPSAPHLASRDGARDPPLSSVRKTSPARPTVKQLQRGGHSSYISIFVRCRLSSLRLRFDSRMRCLSARGRGERRRRAFSRRAISSARFSFCECSTASNNRSRASLRFCACDRESWTVTLMPLGR